MTDPVNGDLPPVPPPAQPATPATPPPAAPTPPTTPTPPAPPATGYAAPAYGTAGVVAPRKTLSLIGMIAGIVGLLGFWVVFIPIVGSILQLFIPAAALVLGIMGRKREGLPAKGFWLTAIITGIIGLAIAVIALIGWIVVFVAAGANGAFNTTY